MAVTARMKVTNVVDMNWGPDQDVKEVTLTPDYAGGKNAEWAAATPNAVFRMTIGNPAAHEQLKEGTCVEVTLTPVED